MAFDYNAIPFMTIIVVAAMEMDIVIPDVTMLLVDGMVWIVKKALNSMKSFLENSMLS